MKKYRLPLSKTNTLADCPQAYQNFLNYTSNHWEDKYDIKWVQYLDDELAKYNAKFDSISTSNEVVNFNDEDCPPTELIFESESDYLLFALRWR